MSNAFRGQTQYQQSPMNFGGYGVGGLGRNSFAQLGSDPYGGMGGFGGGYGGGYGGGFGSPFSSSLGGYGTTFGGMNMGGYGGGYSQPSLVPQYQPTINDAFSQYFSQQYYGGDAFNPFAATSLFGGGFGGGFGFGGGMGGRRGGGRGRRRSPQDELPLMGGPAPMPRDWSKPVGGPVYDPADRYIGAPVDPFRDLNMYAGGSPGFYSQQQPIVSEPAISQMPANFPMMPDMGQFFQPQQSQQPIMQPYQPTYQAAPMTEEDMIRARAAIRSGAFSAL